MTVEDVISKIITPTFTALTAVGVSWGLTQAAAFKEKLEDVSERVSKIEGKLDSRIDEVAILDEKISGVKDGLDGRVKRIENWLNGALYSRAKRGDPDA